LRSVNGYDCSFLKLSEGRSLVVRITRPTLHQIERDGMSDDDCDDARERVAAFFKNSESGQFAKIAARLGSSSPVVG
jgi:hypothetical protein